MGLSAEGWGLIIGFATLFLALLGVAWSGGYRLGMLSKAVESLVSADEDRTEDIKSVLTHCKESAAIEAMLQATLRDMESRVDRIEERVRVMERD